MKTFTLFLFSFLLISCAESSFELADDSPLPHYFQISDSTDRADYRVEYRIYQDRAEMTLYLASSDKKLAELSGISTTHPLSKKNNSQFEYPNFSLFDFNGETEILELRRADAIIYVVHENDIIEYFDSINSIKPETFEVRTDVELNNGEKWKANPETISGVANLKKLITEFNQIDNSDSIADLSSSLETEFKLIFKNCTMTGAAHDQLHNYLLPILGMMKKLKTPPVEDQQNELKKMKKYLTKFDSYFN